MCLDLLRYAIDFSAGKNKRRSRSQYIAVDPVSSSRKLTLVHNSTSKVVVGAVAPLMEGAFKMWYAGVTGCLRKLSISMKMPLHVPRMWIDSKTL
jgi:hypothetical protein